MVEGKSGREIGIAGGRANTNGFDQAASIKTAEAARSGQSFKGITNFLDRKVEEFTDTAMEERASIQEAEALSDCY